jgi:hypothetical protein
MEHQEYQTQVYHAPSMTVQKEFQYPDSPRAVASSSASSRTVVSPAGSPRSTRRANMNRNASNANIDSVVSTSFDGDDDYIDSLKSSTDVYRERGANLRALELLNTEVAGNGNDGNRPNDGVNNLPPVSALTARKAAVLRYEQQQKEKMALKTKLQSDIETYVKRAAPPVLVAASRRTKLAETTRKVVALKEDEGIDRIADMKCQLDLDREKEAMLKALRLLNHGFMY